MKKPKQFKSDRRRALRGLATTPALAAVAVAGNANAAPIWGGFLLARSQIGAVCPRASQALPRGYFWQDEGQDVTLVCAPIPYYCSDRIMPGTAYGPAR